MTISRMWAMGLCATIVLSACVGEDDQELGAILATLQSVADRIPDSVSVCVSNRYLSDPDSTLEPDLLERLRLAGWSLYDPWVGEDSTNRRTLPPDRGEAMIIVGSAKLEEGIWVVRTADTQTDRRGNYVSWGVFENTHRVSCESGACEVIDAVQNGHGDGGMDVARYDAYDRPNGGMRQGERR